MLLVILLQKLSAGLHFGQGEIISQTMASQGGVRLWNIIHFSPPHLWPLLMLMGKRGRATAFFLPISSYPLQVHLAPPEGQSTGLPGHYVDPRVPPLPQRAFVKLQGKIWPRKSSPVQAISVPAGRAHMTTNILCLKDSLGAIQLLAVVVVCRSFKRNHWSVLVSSKNKLQYQWRMRRSCVIFMIQQQKLPPGGTSHQANEMQRGPKIPPHIQQWASLL